MYCMILDNDEISAGLLVHTLKLVSDCTYHVFSSPLLFIEALKEAMPDMIICNVTAKQCDARELFKNNEIDAPFMFISSLLKSEEQRHCYLNADYPYITGFPTPNEMLQYIQSHGL